MTRPELCVGAIVIHDERLLLIKRGRGTAIGAWSIPGGRVEWGETLEAATLRELYEETGLRGTCGRLVGWVERISDDDHFVVVDFVVSVPSAATGALVAGDDASDARWQDLHRLDELDMVDGLVDFLREHHFIDVAR